MTGRGRRTGPLATDPSHVDTTPTDTASLTQSPATRWWESPDEMQKIIDSVEEQIAADLRKTVAEYREWLEEQAELLENADGPKVAACAACGKYFDYTDAGLMWVTAGAVTAEIEELGQMSPLLVIHVFCSDLCTGNKR